MQEIDALNEARLKANYSAPHTHIHIRYTRSPRRAYAEKEHIKQ